MRGSQRTHLILIPGFVGFDVLGQVGYYAGVTERFAAWRRSGAARGEVMLHYFDSFPTASVGLRAERLRAYLAKLVARGQIATEDRIALIGHSTGGLDIRKAVEVLASDADGVTPIDGGVTVPHAALLGCIERLVFISVPHFGTNIAEFAHSYRATIQATIRNAGLYVLLNRRPIDAVRRSVLARFATNSDLLLAIGDTLDESDERGERGAEGAEGERLRASEREARAQLALWLEHMGNDFHALEDLRCPPAPWTSGRSPAHYDAGRRSIELRAFRGLAMQSYATRVRCSALPSWTVAALKLVAPAANLPWQLLNFVARQWLWQPVSLASALARIGLQLPALTGGLASIHGQPSLPFRAFHTLCADPRGPFERPDSAASGVIDFASGERIAADAISPSDNDGVVNTLSMLWPPDALHGSEHRLFLVEADHADIIGHYARKACVTEERERGMGRTHYAYDIFDSGSGFDDAAFARVWEHIFEFCAG